jgi:hypothetical protein
VNAFDNDPTRSGSTAPSGTSGEMHLSLSEISALCTKAARGAGFDWGHAEEAGQAAVWLARAGLPGPAMLCELLEDTRYDAPDPAPGRWRGRRPLCPLCSGVGLQEYALLPEGVGGGALILVQVACPGLILPFAARAAIHLGLSLRVEWPGASVSLPLENGDVLPPGNWQDSGPVDITLTPAAREGLPSGGAGPVASVGRVAHHDATILSIWQRLDALALRTTVPASERSRVGAGGGGSDND